MMQKANKLRSEMNDRKNLVTEEDDEMDAMNKVDTFCNG